MKKNILSTLIISVSTLSMPLFANPTIAQEDAAPVALTNEDNIENEDITAAAEEEEESEWTLSAEFGIDFCSKQVTYGLIDNPHAIFMPSASLSYGHDDFYTITIGVMGCFDTTNYGAKDGYYNDRKFKYQELDFTVGIYKNWDTTDFIGSTLDSEFTYLYEYHPRSCNKPEMDWSYPDTQYLYLTLSAPDYWWVPTFEIEYNIDDQQDSKGAIYATFDVHHEFDIGSTMGLDEGFMTLTPTLGIGFGNKHRNAADFYDYYEETGEKVDNFMLRDAYAHLELYINPFEGFSIAPYIGIHQQIDNDAREATGDDDFVAYAGLGFYYEM